MLVMKEGKALYRRCRVGNCFLQNQKKAKKGKVQWNRGDLQFDLQTFWDCLNYWSHNKLSSEFFKKRETVQASLPDVVLVDKEVFVSVQVPASTPSLLLGRGRVGSVGQVVQVVPATWPWKNNMQIKDWGGKLTNQESWDSRRCSSSRRPWTSGWSWCCCRTCTGSADRPRRTCGRSEKKHVEDLQEEVWHSWGTEQSSTNPLVTRNWLAIALLSWKYLSAITRVMRGRGG